MSDMEDSHVTAEGSSDSADSLVTAVACLEVETKRRCRRQAISPGSEEYVCLVQVHMDEAEHWLKPDESESARNRRKAPKQGREVACDGGSNALIAFLTSSPLIVDQGVMAVKSGYVFRRRCAMAPRCRAFEMAKAAAEIDKERRNSIGTVCRALPLHPLHNDHSTGCL